MYYTEELNDGNRDVGYPCLQINMEEVAETRMMGLTFAAKIIEIIGVIRSTLYRLLEDSNLLMYVTNQDCYDKVL